MKELLYLLLFVNVLRASPISNKGGACVYNGTTYNEGEKVSPDSCNTCVCRSGMMQCTHKFCITDKPEPRCFYKGQYYISGAEVLSPDCNTCFCSNGVVNCTKMHCSTNEENSREAKAVS